MSGAGGNDVRANIFEWIILALGYVGTGGVWASEFGKRNKTLVFVLGLLAFANTGYFIFERWNDWFGPAKTPDINSKASPQPATPTPLPTPTVNAPTIDSIIPPDTLIKVGVASREGSVAYSIINMGFANASDIDASLWTVSAGGPKKVHSRTISYLGKGDTITNDNLRAPSGVSRFVTCVAFTVNKRRVERIEFFSDDDQTPHQRLTQPLRHFKEPVLDVGGTKGLCSSMPASAGALSAARVETQARQPAGRYCVTVNGRQVCE